MMFTLEAALQHFTEQQELLLRAIDLARNIDRFYYLTLQPTLFSTHTLIVRYGRQGTHGQCKTYCLAHDAAVDQLLRRLIQRRLYR